MAIPYEPDLWGEDLAGNLNSAVTAVLEQIGGVDGDGVRHAGNLDATNLTAAPGFVAAQKEKARSVFALPVRRADTDSMEVGPFSDPVTIVGVRYEPPPGGTDAWTTTVTIDIKIHGQKVATFTQSPPVPVNVEGATAAAVTIQAGEVATFEMSGTGGGTGGDCGVLVHFAASHRR